MIGRPFQKGQSGNPGGRPKGIGAKAREHADRAIEVLAAGLDDEDARVRIAAAKELLDRGWGKSITMQAEVHDPFAEFSDEELEQQIADLDVMLKAMRNPTSGTTH